MNVQEAKKKWCPFGRATDGNGGAAVNRAVLSGSPDQDCLCLADGCACWRWVSAADQETTITQWVDHPDNQRLKELEREISDCYCEKVWVENSGRYINVVPGYMKKEFDKLIAEQDDLRRLLLNAHKAGDWQPTCNGWSLIDVARKEDDSPCGGLVATFIRDKTDAERSGYCGLAGKPY